MSYTSTRVSLSPSECIYLSSQYSLDPSTISTMANMFGVLALMHEQNRLVKEKYIEWEGNTMNRYVYEMNMY